MYQASISQPKTLTVEEACRMCNAVNEKVAAVAAKNPNLTCDDLYELISQSEPDLVSVYPTVAVSIASGCYFPSVAREFFESVRRKPWETEEEFIETQAMYGVMLQCEIARRRGAHLGAKDKAAIKSKIVDDMVGQRREMHEKAEKAKKIAAERVARIATDKREALAAKVAAGAPAAGISVEFIL